jgi:hypothetical protein
VEILSQEKLLKMKKIIAFIMIAGLAFTFMPNQLKAASANSTSASTTITESKSASALLVRLDEIKTMDKSNLCGAEKKSLRKEVRTIRQQLSTIGGGIYISAGALIIIIILLIILL